MSRSSSYVILGGRTIFFLLRFFMASLIPYLAPVLAAPEAMALPAIKIRGMMPPRWWVRRRLRLRRGAIPLRHRPHMVLGTVEGRFPGFISFHGRRPRPRARPRPRPRRGGGGPEVRVEVRRTDGLPPSSYTVVTVLVCVMLRMRLPRARSCASSFSKSNRRRKPRPRSSSSSSSSSSSDGGEESGDGGEGTRGRRRGCLAATVGRPVGVVTVEVVVLVPAPALRRAVEGREGAVVVVVAVVTGRGLGRLELLVVVVAVGRVRVDVVGRVWVAVVVAGVVPVPATGGKVKAFKASSTLTG